MAPPTNSEGEKTCQSEYDFQSADQIARSMAPQRSLKGQETCRTVFYATRYLTHHNPNNLTATCTQSDSGVVPLADREGGKTICGSVPDENV